jgi:alkylation response protein AidB-like acyl-CoA dehydrogenase
MRGGLGLTEARRRHRSPGHPHRRPARRRRLRDHRTKTWISNAIEGDCVALLVKTDPDAQPRYKAEHADHAQVDPDTRAPLPGVSNGKKLEKLGYKGNRFRRVHLRGLPLLGELSLVGGEEGQGFYMATGGLEIGRINIAARSVGIARRALMESIKYAQVRKTMGKPIAEHQAIQLKLGDMGAKTRAAELLVEDAARAYDRGERVDMEAGMAKYFASETRVEVATDAMRIHGGYGYSKEYVIERLYRDAPLMCIGEGTNEIQRVIIAKQLVARNKVCMHRPLEGVRILAVEQYGAGPYGTQLLANSARR